MGTLPVRTERPRRHTTLPRVTGHHPRRLLFVYRTRDPRRPWRKIRDLRHREVTDADEKARTCRPGSGVPWTTSRGPDEGRGGVDTLSLTTALQRYRQPTPAPTVSTKPGGTVGPETQSTGPGPVDGPPRDPPGSTSLGLRGDRDETRVGSQGSQPLAPQKSPRTPSEVSDRDGVTTPLRPGTGGGAVDLLEPARTCTV